MKISLYNYIKYLKKFVIFYKHVVVEMKIGY